MLATPALGVRAQDGAERYAGTYRYAGSLDRQREMIERAVERGVEGLGPIKRAVARRRVLRNNPPTASVTIAVSAGRISVRHDADRIYLSSLNGDPEPGVAPDGAGLRVSHRYEDGRIIEVLASRKATCVIVLSLSSDGSRLTCTVRFQSERLSGPIRYRLVFRRVV